VVQGHYIRYQSSSKAVCDFLLVNNTNIDRISHLQDTAPRIRPIGQIFTVDMGQGMPFSALARKEVNL